MREPRKLSRCAVAALGVGALGLAGLTQTSLASVRQTRPVSSTPAAGTPALEATGTTEQIRQLVQCGTTMYAVGSFTEIRQGSTVFDRNNIFSFSAVAPYRMTPWNPDVNGVVNSITFNGTNCNQAYIGGLFTRVGSTVANNIAKINSTTGVVVAGFQDDADGEVETLLGVKGHILVGGHFKVINNSADRFMASLSPTSGSDDGFLQLNISGNYYFPGVDQNPSQVYNQALSHSGNLDLVMGDFTSVGGQKRQQIFMLDLSTNPATVTGWTSPQWDGSQGESSPGSSNGYPYECANIEPFYIRAAAWSPDDSTIYIGTTGYHPNGYPTDNYPRTGLCDAAAAFPSSHTSVLDKWINYTGCDSLFSAAADASTAYFGGHERWSENSYGCDDPSRSDPGAGDGRPVSLERQSHLQSDTRPRARC